MTGGDWAGADGQIDIQWLTDTMNGCIGPKCKGRLSFQHFSRLGRGLAGRGRLTLEDSPFDG